MPTLTFTTVDVFTTARYAGNPLAIVHLPRDHALPDAQLQTIAREFNLSETVFLQDGPPADDPDLPQWRLRIFTPTAELPFAGHPTIGAARHALPAGGRGRLLCHAGPVEVEVRDGRARAAIPHAFHRHVEHVAGWEGEVRRLQPGLAREGVLGVDVVSPVRGMNFLAVRLAGVEVLGRGVGVTGVQPAPELDEGWDVGFCGSCFYVVEGVEEGEGGGKVVRVRTRMVEGRLEDAATGSAACGLGCLLALSMGLGRRARFEIVQGVEMGRRSEIGVEVVLKEGGGEVETVVLSGSAVEVMEGKLQI